MQDTPPPDGIVSPRADEFPLDDAGGRVVIVRGLRASSVHEALRGTTAGITAGTIDVRPVNELDLPR